MLRLLHPWACDKFRRRQLIVSSAVFGLATVFGMATVFGVLRRCGFSVMCVHGRPCPPAGDAHRNHRVEKQCGQHLADGTARLNVVSPELLDFNGRKQRRFGRGGIGSMNGCF